MAEQDRPRDVYDVILEDLWDTATASVWECKPGELRRAALEMAYWMLFAVVPKAIPAVEPDSP